MESLHSRIQLLWAGRALVVASIGGAVLFAIQQLYQPYGTGVVVVGWLALAVLGLTHAILLYRRWGLEIQDDALYLTRGVLTRVDTSVPYVRVQHTDTRRRPIERLTGLASVVVYTAGSRGADIRIPGLTPERADELREQLRELAVDSESTDAV